MTKSILRTILETAIFALAITLAITSVFGGVVAVLLLLHSGHFIFAILDLFFVIFTFISVMKVVSFFDKNDFTTWLNTLLPKKKTETNTDA